MQSCNYVIFSTQSFLFFVVCTEKAKLNKHERQTKHLLFRMTIDWYQCIIERKNLVLHVWTCSCHYNISVGSEFSHLLQQMQPNHWGNQSSGHLRQAFLEKLEDDQFCWSTSWISYNLNVIWSLDKLRKWRVYCPATVQLQGNFWASWVFFSEKFMSYIHDMNSWSPASKLVLSYRSTLDWEPRIKLCIVW